MSTGLPTQIAFSNGDIILPDRILERGVVICEAGRIVEVLSAENFKPSVNQKVVDAQGGFIGPGYVDIHVHGGDGSDFMDGTAEAVVTANRCHARHGTTTIFPTTTTGSSDQLATMIDACIDVRDCWDPSKGGRIAGVHFYGPYFAVDKVGCHLQSGRRDPSSEEYLAHFDRGIVKIATCAAELPGAVDYYREASRRGYLVTCGHSNASWTEMQKGFDAGLRHVDHFWCAMSCVSNIRTRLGAPFQASMEQFVLMNREMSTEVIADLEHLAPDLLEFGNQMIGPDRLCLMTDANRAVDMPPGKYRFGPLADGEWFESNGRVAFVPGDSLASSVKGMDAMVRNFYNATSATLEEAVRMGSLTPAQRAGVAHEVGSLEIGKHADVLLLDRRLQVKNVYIGGIESDD